MTDFAEKEYVKVDGSSDIFQIMQEPCPETNNLYGVFNVSQAFVQKGEIFGCLLFVEASKLTRATCVPHELIVQPNLWEED